MPRVRAPRIPSLGRISIAVLAWVLPAGAAAQTWTEDEVIARAAEASPEAQSALLAARLEEADARNAGLLPNPWVEWERQEAFGPNRQGQDLVRAVIPLDLSGRTQADQALAQVDAALARASAARTQADVVESALRLFYRALALERRAELLARALEALEEARRVLAARAAEGDVAGYDAARLAVESELARSHVSEAVLDAAAARGSLAAMLASQAPRALEGELAPSMPASLAALLARAQDRRADRAAVRSAEEAAARARSAASFAWVPMLELTGGYNRVFDAVAEGHGYVFVLSAAIPLFDNGQQERDRSAVADSLMTSYREGLDRQIAAEVRAARGQLVGLLAERERFATAVAEPVEIVVRASASGYREGERSVVELVDARRSATEAGQRTLALELAARLAELRLRRVSGALR